MPAQRNSTTPGDLSIPQAATYYNVHTRTIRRLIASGSLPAYRVRGTSTIRIRLEDLDALKEPIGGGAA
jgi:excisionase family DNA binding protein